MKKTIAFLLSLFMIMSLVACSNTQRNNDSETVSSEDSSQTSESTQAQITETESLLEEDDVNELDADLSTSELEEGEGGNILIAYFTYGENVELPNDVDASATASIQVFNGKITGNTGVMAHMIAEASGGELFSIRTVEPYPNSYDDTIDVGQDEKNNDIRPELSTHIENLEQYDTIFVGFPNWLAYHNLIQCTQA